MTCHCHFHLPYCVIFAIIFIPHLAKLKHYPNSKAHETHLLVLKCSCKWNHYVCWFIPVSPNQNARPCKKPCSLRTSCSNCTSNGMECMWCSSTKRCVDSNAYIISFPYGQCLEWQTATCSRKYLSRVTFHFTAT